MNRIYILINKCSTLPGYLVEVAFLEQFLVILCIINAEHVEPTYASLMRSFELSFTSLIHYFEPSFESLMLSLLF